MKYGVQVVLGSTQTSSMGDGQTDVEGGSRDCGI